MASGGRLPTTRERENNRRRERRRRAIAAKIFSGLRAYGNYKLPKHCDNNEVLKALCDEAGWVVEQDGTTYRKGCKPAERTDPVGLSVSPSPCSSYQPSRCTSYNPSPTSSSFPSPERSPYGNNYRASDRDNDYSLPPWLKTLPPKHHHLFMQQGGSISAPVTPPLSSPTCRSPRRLKIDHEAALSFLQSSTPSSPRRQAFPRDSSWLAGICIPSESPASPTYNLMSQNPFSPFGSPSARTPGQSGTCSPVMVARHEDAEMRTHDDEFAFESSGDGSTGLVKAWEGETIHEECGPDELELTLGITRTSSA